MKMAIKINGQWHEVWGLMANTIDHVVFPQSPEHIHIGDVLPDNTVKMTAETPLYGGYTEAQLRTAFDKVKDKQNWKNPIDALVDPSEDMKAISAAIAFYVGSPSDYVKVMRKGKEMIRVRAAGYYESIGS